jgi:hypothetical protein
MPTNRPLPCPRCGKRPTLHYSAIHVGTEAPSGDSVRWMCVKWLGLRTCFAGAPPVEFRSGYADDALAAATAQWNAESARVA